VRKSVSVKGAWWVASLGHQIRDCMQAAGNGQMGWDVVILFRRVLLRALRTGTSSLKTCETLGTRRSPSGTRPASDHITPDEHEL